MTWRKNNRDSPEYDMQFYAGRWVARLGNKIIGQGGTPDQALQAAKASRIKETPEIAYIPTAKPLLMHPLIKQVRGNLPKGLECYLVGGAIRDSLLGKPVHDLDFVMPESAIMAAKKIADALGGAFYALDATREIGRVIFEQPDGERLLLDFSIFQGPNLESDLIARDFTINALAVNIEHPQLLLDPLGGHRDLQEKQLRACSPKSFKKDPVRIVRAIRLAAAFDLHILPETRELMHSAITLLPQVSVERLREELFRILADRQPTKAIRALNILGAIPYILPELSQLKGVNQSPPHIYDVWAHTLDVVNKLELLLDVLATTSESEAPSDLFMSMVVTHLDRYREQIKNHLDTHLVIDRSLRSLLFLAALYHDIGKPDSREVDENGHIRFFKHDQSGAEIVAERAQLLHLSNSEVDRLHRIVRYHLRPLFLTQTGKPLTRRAIYRFFRDCGVVGIDVCLLSLADVLGTYGPTLPLDKWNTHLEVVRSLFEAWWERSNESINPPTLVNGHDLLKEFDLEPGPIVGKLLESIREAQVTGQVSSRLEAIKLAKDMLN
jgi:putative nucleotidyltransferase with HDIG domain